ncbi:(deoxy)nucleoside triphosphate pyrophosphohydrolase [Janibacter massiliensis]|uniref:(deoxy)nucleoside triphosphate pyrophosphohydrolase n=1 Tax=Janibacter massiliensis TaxID=2058291 RepID=UPI000D113B95|nr:(deoxy)nucleoside triphosphate pyrophosphohydrolase [Janibacter massiliensis]
MSGTETDAPVARHIRVVAAVIVHEGHVLCARRGSHGPLAGLWEFPGGKIEEGEQPEVALAREINEELECAITVGRRITTTDHQYEFGLVSLTSFYCTLAAGTPTLTEHTEVRWQRPKDLAHLEWAPADVPAVRIVTADLGDD